VKEYNSNWDKRYGKVLFDRAIGEAPEMESSKATSEELKNIIKKDDKVLDIGCGAGHYLVSLKKEITVPFSYTGGDVRPHYIELAKKAFEDMSDVNFKEADLFNLPFEDNSFDVVMCCNVLLHLPSIKKPMAELMRVAKRVVFVRTLIDERSFRVKEVHDNNGDEFDDNGEPKKFLFLNTYSKKYIKSLLPGKQVEILEDKNFSSKSITAAIEEQSEQPNVTRMLGGKQISGNIVFPWCFIKIKL
tara:strand:- start:96 stop:830 length:735 start_codon:yes stop_codon:yes gene_type:complete